MGLYAVINEQFGRLMSARISPKEAGEFEELLGRHPAAQCEVIKLNPIDELGYYLKKGMNKLREGYNSLGVDIKIAEHSTLALLTGVLAQYYANECGISIANNQLFQGMLQGAVAVVAGSLSLANARGLVNNLSIEGADIDTKDYIDYYKQEMSPDYFFNWRP